VKVSKPTFNEAEIGAICLLMQAGVKATTGQAFDQASMAYQILRGRLESAVVDVPDAPAADGAGEAPANGA
jgi:hypothetical protein